MDDLKHQVMINQFALAAGCLANEAKTFLKSSEWQFEIALSNYFQESGIPHQNKKHPLCPPTNTPATPPAFPDALLAFSKMQATDNNKQSNNGLNKPVTTQCNQQPIEQDFFMVSSN